MSSTPAVQKAQAAPKDPRHKHFLLSGEGWPYLLVPLIPVALVLELVHAAPAWVFLASALGDDPDRGADGPGD